MAALRVRFFRDFLGSAVAVYAIVLAVYVLVDAVESWSRGAGLEAGEALHFARRLGPMEVVLAGCAVCGWWERTGRWFAVSVTGHRRDALVTPAIWAGFLAAGVALGACEGAWAEGWSRAGDVIDTGAHRFSVRGGLVEPQAYVDEAFLPLAGPDAPLWLLDSSRPPRAAWVWVFERLATVVHVALLAGLCVWVKGPKSGVWLVSVAVAVVLLTAALVRGASLGTTPLAALALPSLGLLAWSLWLRRGATR